MGFWKKNGPSNAFRSKKSKDSIGDFAGKYNDINQWLFVKMTLANANSF